MVNSFKLGNPLAILDGNRHFKWIGNLLKFSSFAQRLAGKKAEPFFRIEGYLDNHSKDIAKIIHDYWTKESGLFASCVYNDGVKYLHPPSEPQVTKTGLARQHLMFGYQHNAWEFYRTGKDESVKKCKEIEEIIEKYDKTVLGEIEKDIETSSGNQRLERKTRGKVFIVKGEYEYYPDTFDFRS